MRYDQCTTGGCEIQYTARENDQTGLYFYRARYYDPVLKQWLSEDPIGIEGGINQRAYVDGNPVSNIDPDGLVPRGGRGKGKRGAGGPLGGGGRGTSGGSSDSTGSKELDDALGISSDKSSSGSSSADELPSGGSCSPDDWEFCYRKCGGRWNTQGCYIQYQWKYRMINFVTGGSIREAIKIINCNCCDD